MRGRLNGLALMILASLVPLLSWASGAVLALVALRRGLFEGALLAVGGTVVLAILFGLLFGTPTLAVRPLLESWVPVLLLAGWLRATISLSGTIRLAGILAAVAVIGLYLAFPDQAAYWGQVLARMDELFVGATEQNLQAWRAVRERVLPYMAGLMVLSQLSVVIAALLLGRWWQGLLYNPGGFRREFHELDLGRTYALAAAVLLTVASWRGPGLIYDIALVVGAVFVLQALALAHAGVALRNWSRGWLWVLYLLLPFAFELMVVVGIVGAVFGWRRRLQERAGPDGGPT